jgi:tRNA A37 N6-isopentenylltransferase MiaA
MTKSNANIVLIDGPTGSGKTQYIKALGATPANTLSSAQLIDILLQMCWDKPSLEEAAKSLKHITYIENIESLAGRPQTQRLAAQLVALIASEHCVMLTGIDFQNRTPFLLETLDVQKANYVWKTTLDTVIED